MSRSRQFGVVLALLVVAGALALAALSQVWVVATVGGGGLPTLTEGFTGRRLLPAAAGGAVLILAGVAGVLATRGLGRRIVGVVLALAGVGVAAAAVSFGLALPESARTEAVATTGFDQLALTANSWWLVVVAAGVLAALAGVVVAWRGNRWPVLGGRYERRRVRPGSTAATPEEMSPSAAWDALDRGEDPTTVGEVTE
ncbi:MAG: Trp biosynthesis-associated membrane protein [Actinobacteria bacterium]|nr:Trp biosynthesis-associated membrane protein [Actinomycetota bacterium]